MINVVALSTHVKIRSSRRKPCFWCAYLATIPSFAFNAAKKSSDISNPMSDNKIYEVLEIMRHPNICDAKVKSTFLFSLALFKDDIMVGIVSPSLYSRLVKGGLFRGDFVNVTKGPDGILYEVFDPQTPSGITFTSDKVFLPFLNDTVIMPRTELPLLEIIMLRHPKSLMQRYQSTIGDIISVDEYLSKRVCLPIVGRVVMKSRVRTYSFFKRNAYCFQVIMQGSKNLKVTLWGKCAAYHAAISTGDFIVVQEYRRGKGSRNENYIVYNSFHEDLYLNMPEIKVNSGTVYMTHMVPPVDVIISLRTPLNHVVEGKITYMSVLMRHRTRWEEYTDIYEHVYEYYLIKVDGSLVILYSNSTKTFYDLEVGMSVRLSNMRVYVRGDTQMYLSTIYTEVAICEGEDESNGTELVQGALGFIPDSGLDLSTLDEEHTESFQIGKREKNVVVVQLWKPEPITLADLDKNTSTLVINESRKYVLKARLVGYNFTSFSKDENAVMKCTPSIFTSVSYLKNNTPCDQRSAAICVEDDYAEKTLLLFKNYYLHSEVPLVERLNGCRTLEELSSMVGSWLNFIVDVFRASERSIIACLSQALQ